MRVMLLAILLCASTTARAQEAARSDQAIVRTIAVAAGPAVVISAAGPLPMPRVGVLHDPERIYLDLAGVSTRSLRAAGDGGLVTSVRVAQNSLDPLVARVVIDLTQPCRYSVNGSRRADGHLELALTPGASITANAPAPHALPPSGAPPANAGGIAARRYTARLRPVLANLTVLRDALKDIDKRMAPPADRMAKAEEQLTALRATVEALRPPRALADAHDLLKTVAAFSATALSLTANSTGPVPWDASSAAAGALLMLDRATAELSR